MKKFCSRFQNSILMLFAACLYVGGFLVLFALLGIDSRQVRVLSRTSVIMGLAYVMFMTLFTKVYGRFRVGRSQPHQVRLSLALAFLFTDICTYAVFIIMNTNDANNRVLELISLHWLLASFVLQALLTSVLVAAGDRFYRWIVPPQKTLVVLQDIAEKGNVVRVINACGARFVISEVVRYDDADIKAKMRHSDAVFFYDVPAGEKQMLKEYCYKHLTSVYCNPDLSDILTMTSEEMMFGDLPFLAKEFGGLTMEQRIVKRLMDIFVSLLGLIISSPFLLIAAAAIKLDDGGPVLFRQKRATIRGRVFEIYKFRTMKVNAPNISVSKNDDRITKAGKFLRKYRIDELPQLINIMKGDMSLVGPRPEMLENVNEYERELPEFRYRLRMKAGLTGLAQVVGRYNTSSRDKLVLDLMYIENFSILLDIKLMLQTLLVLFKAEDSTEGFEEDAK